MTVWFPASTALSDDARYPDTTRHVPNVFKLYKSGYCQCLAFSALNNMHQLQLFQR